MSIEEALLYKCILRVVPYLKQHFSDTKFKKVSQKIAYECLICMMATMYRHGFALKYVISCRTTDRPRKIN